MPITADTERQLLNHYKLTSLHPDVWPHQDDESSEDEEEQESNSVAPGHSRTRTSLSRFQRIDRHASILSAPKDSESLVQKDEPDPLGVKPSVAVELKRRGLPVEENLKLRNRFMLSSTSFSPVLFLSQVHQDASTEDLLRGLDFLSTSIEQKSASLKVLVESNFEKFVKAKATIDNVYTEMRSQGSDEPLQTQTSNNTSAGSRRPHSRHTSRGASHFRSTSGQTMGSGKALPLQDKRKNALTKDSEYGVQGVKLPLQEVAIKAEEVWGPALGGREKEETLKSVLYTLDQNRDIFMINGKMAEAIRKNDYDSVVDIFKQAKQYAAEARSTADRAKSTAVQLGESDIQLIIVTAKMWHDVSLQTSAFKQSVWRRLRTSHGRKSAATGEDMAREEHMELIAVLLQLGLDPEDNSPIWEWLHNRYLYLRDKMARSFERSRIEIEILRRRLASNTDQVDPTILANHLRAVTRKQAPLLRLNSQDSEKDVDQPSIIAFWEKILASLTALLAHQSGILGDVIEYWDTANSFINNTAQKSFPIGVFATGSGHLELKPDDVANLRSGAMELVDILRQSIMSFFADSPVEDLSDLYSPIPPTPITPESANTATPGGTKRTFTFDPNNVPPPSIPRGSAWEQFAFWPPQANSLSGSLFLSKTLTIVGTAAAEMVSMSVVKQSRGGEGLKTLVGAVRERCIQAVCAAWITDAERCNVLETWNRNADRRELTTFPASFSAFMEKVLGDLQRIAYISEAVPVRGSTEVIVPPPTKLLQVLRSTFVSTLYKALEGMVEKAKTVETEGQEIYDPDRVTKPREMSADNNFLSSAVDSSSRNIRILLTLSNLAQLRAEIVPHLLAQFETNFSVKLTDETKAVHDFLGKIESQLFQSYVRPTVDKINDIIRSGITSPVWVPSSTTQFFKPTDAKPYVYDALLTLVLVHSEVTTTAAPLTNSILSYFLEQASLGLIDAFKQHKRYTLPALMQATLDVEFMAQTLNNYTTDRAGEVQSQIYLALDERTDNDARSRLQSELPEMRAVLKRLRERTRGEFGCFRRERRGRTDRVGTVSGRTT